jgi:hypothetical protein
MRSNFSLATVLLSILLTFSSCDFDKRSDDQIAGLIESKSDSLLFLSFWPKMTDKDFERVKSYEENKGRLENGKFNILFPGLQKNGFDIMHGTSIVYLENEMEEFVSWDGSNKVPSSDGYLAAEKYYNLIDYLVQTFDKKYQRYNHPDLGRVADMNTLRWIEQSKIITLLYFVRFYDSYASTGGVWLSSKERNSEVPNYRKYMGWNRFNRDERRKRDRVAFGEIQIRYELLEDVLNDVQNKMDYENERNIQYQQERKRKDKEIDKNRSLL